MLQEKDQIWLEDVLHRIHKKMDWVSEKSKDKIPYTTVNGVHDNRADNTKEFRADDGVNWWCNGFWAGMMWLMYHETGEERYASIARYTEEKLDQCFVDYYGPVSYTHLDVYKRQVYKSLAKKLNRARTIPGKHKKIEGVEQLDKSIDIDQSPIGRTPNMCIRDRSRQTEQK